MNGPRPTRRWPWILVALLATTILLIGPWPLPPDHYPDEPWAQATFQRLHRIPIQSDHGLLRAGVARRDISPPPGIPLAGYGARHPKENTGTREPLHVTALTLSAGRLKVTVVGGDYLLPLPKLVEAVRRATGLPAEALYFTASHTHSGAGGYDDGLISRTNLGDFHPEYFHRLVTAFSEAIQESRRATVPVHLRYTRLRLTGKAAQLNIYRLTHSPIHPTLHLLEAFSGGRRLAFLVTSSIHPTILGKHNRLASGDFPALLIQDLERDGGMGLYAAGAVGGTTPGIPSGEDPTAQDQQRHALATRLATLIRQGVIGGGPDIHRTARWEADTSTLARARLTVDLPPPVYHLGERLRLSPMLVRALFHPANQTHLDALRIGPLWLSGIPADFSAELAEDLERWGEKQNGHIWITGFNGDYLGYLMPRSRYATPHYTTRDANLYGPAAGDYFRDLSQALLKRLANTP